MYCNQCGKGNYDGEEYYEEEEVKYADKKGEDRRDFDKDECFKPVHKPEPKCHEWEEEFVCKFYSKCFPKKHCKPCKPCCPCCDKK